MIKQTILLSILWLSFAVSFAQDNNKQKAKKIHQKALTVDSHTDTPLRFVRSEFEISENHDPKQTGSKVDLPRMKEGGLDAVFFAAFIGQDARTQEANEKATQKVQTIIDSIYAQLERNSSMAGIATSPGDAYKLEDQGKSAIYIGIENGYALGNDISLVEKFFDRGVRYITLCHTKNNDICDSSTDSVEHNGLSEFGKKVVKEMNRVGMMIDVSHISDKSFYDVLDISEDPIIASHSNARTLRDHPRNLDDNMLKKLAENNGVIQVCFVTDYIKKPDPAPKRDSAYQALRVKYNHFKNLTDEEMEAAREEWYAINRKYPQKLAAVSELVDHIDHIVKVAGINYIGIGTDFDGGGALKGCFGVSEMENITLELVNRGYSEKEIYQIWGGNFMRVFNEVLQSKNN